jgi:hypothetical protein
MKASETDGGKVKQSEKIGGLHKDTGSYGFNGLARLFGRASISRDQTLAATKPGRRGAAGDLSGCGYWDQNNPPCGVSGRLIRFAALFARQ